MIFWQSDKSDKKSNIFICFEARRWVYCEFFYSGVDQQLFLGDSDFITLVHDAFPNLRCKKLRRPEWRVIRKCIGKPRRFSQAFLDEERIALQTKRYFLPLLRQFGEITSEISTKHFTLKAEVCSHSLSEIKRIEICFSQVFFSCLIFIKYYFRTRIRQIYEGSIVDLPADSMDLPLKLPRPLAVGVKIYARVRQPKDGIYAGTIDAVLPDSYRVVFDKEEMIPPMIVKDYEVMSEQKVLH